MQGFASQALETLDNTVRDIRIIGVPDIPLIETGDDLATILGDALATADLHPQNGDVLVVTSKIVSKAQGRWTDINTIKPDAEAERVARLTGKDPREVALVLSESARISRLKMGVLITTHKLGFTSANAGMDHSNTRPGDEWRLLLPVDPDGTAHQLRAALMERFDVTLSIVISDSHGRPFRMGTVGVGIGSAGLPALWDLRGEPDLFGVPLEVTDVGFADELAAAAGMVMGQAADRVPAALIRGLDYPVDEDSTAADLVRPPEMDLYQ